MKRVTLCERGPWLNFSVWEALPCDGSPLYIATSMRTKWDRVMIGIRDNVVDLCLAEVYHGEKEVGTKR